MAKRRRTTDSSALCLLLVVLLFVNASVVHSQTESTDLDTLNSISTVPSVISEDQLLTIAPNNAPPSDTTSDTTTNSPVLATSSPNCPSDGFDFAFLNSTQNELISIYENAPEEACEIDTLIDRILPPDYEVARNFSLAATSKVAHINDTFITLNRLRQLATNYSQTFNPVMQRVMTRFSFLIYEIQLSPPCFSSILSIMGALNKNEFWAMKFMDSSGRIPSGVLEGILSSVGDYEECLNIRSPEVVGDSSESRQPFTGQYCWAQPVIPHPDRGTYHKADKLTKDRFGVPPRLVDEIVDVLYLLNGSFVHIGLCIPSTCSAAEVENAINTILYPITQIPVRIGPECVTKEKRDTIKLDFYQQMALYTFGGLFALTLLASFYEFVLNDLGLNAQARSNTHSYQVSIKMTDQNNNGVNGTGTGNDQVDNNAVATSKQKNRLSVLSRLIISFSLVNNTRLMFKVSPNKFAAIDFIRFLMLCEIMLMHQYYVALGWSAWPLTKRFIGGLIQKVGTDFRYAFLRNIHNTDFFFALTGLLLTYSSLRNLERSKGRFNYLSFAMNMYLRFYPAVFGTILLFYLLPLFGDGPFWHRVDHFHVESCRKNLMANMLTYNFYILDMETFYQNSMCNIASWWVTSCFHLILLSPLLIIPLYHSAQSLWLVVGSIIAGSCLSVGHIWWKGIPFMNQISLMNSIFEESFYSIFYTWPFIHHMAPYALGILAGYLIRRHPKIYLGGWFGETLLTIVFVGLSALGFYWTQDMLKSDTDMTALATGVGAKSTLEIYLNITVGKLMFCIGFMWIFYLCCTNRSAFLTNLCTWPGLQPLYSLSLGLYLTNFIPPLFTTFSTPDVVEFTDFHILKNGAFNFSLTVMLSYVIHVLFERPVMNILKIVESG